MKKKFTDFAEYRDYKLKDPEIKKEYDRLQPEFALVHAILRARAKKGMTQKQMAKNAGTKQSVISRFESGRGNPTLSFLQKLADSLDSHLEIRFVEN